MCERGVGTYSCQAVGMYFDHVVQLVKEFQERPGKLAETPVYCRGLRMEVT